MNSPRWFNGWPAAFLLLTLHWGMAVSATRQQSCTFDEIAHLTAGCSYWRCQDYRLQPENGNLPQRWAALPFAFDTAVRFPRLDQAMWRESFVWGIGHQFLYQSGNDAASLLWRGRAMIALFSVALGALVYAWSRRLFGPSGGLVSVLLYTFCPTMLAHGARATSDMAAGLLLLSASWTWWRLLHRVTPASVLLSGLACGLLCVAKMSAVLLLPMAALMVVVRLWSTTPLEIGWRGGRRLSGRWRQMLVFAAAGVGQMLVAAWVVWAFYGFRFSALSVASGGGTLSPGWATVLEKPGLWTTVVGFLRAHHLLPEAFLYGYSYVYTFSQMRSAFLNGEYSVVGWPSFFPYCWLLKTPLAVFGVIGLAATAALRFSGSIKRGVYATAPLWILLVVYWAAALSSHLNLGHRHLLPTYPVIYILSGAAALWFMRPLSVGRVAVWAVAAVLVVESFLCRPHYLAFFNLLTGGPRLAYRHLVDSSLDWGQDLPSLRTWLDSHALNSPTAPAYLSYFGTGDPAYYGIGTRRLPGYPDTGASLDRLPLAGGVYCISATMLQQVYTQFPGRWAVPYERAYQQVVANLDLFEKARNDPQQRKQLLDQHGPSFWNQQAELFLNLRFGRLCAYLRQRSPDTMVGYSILVYCLTDQQVQDALSGPPAELAPTVRVKGMSP